MDKQPRRAAIYARISNDKVGAGLGVQRQEADCRALCERNGWKVADVYVDNDLSAYSGKPRPAYLQMLHALEAHQADTVVCWHPDRLHRSPKELESFIDLIESTGATVETVTAGSYDLSTPAGRLVARQVGSVSRYESEHKSERIQRQKQQAALAGDPTGGPRPFGYEPGGLEIRESEAELLREAARRVLAGEAMRSIAAEWNDAGIRTARGNEWSVNSLRAVLTGPRIGGLRAHRGEVVGPGRWPAIIDRTTHAELVALANRRRRPGRPPKLLLTGLLVCGREGCGEPLTSSVLSGKTRVYKCRRSPGEHHGCQRLSVSADPVDKFMTEAILHRLSTSTLNELIGQTASGDGRDLMARIESDERALAELVDAFYVERSVPRAAFLQAKRRLEDRLERSRAELNAQAGDDVLESLPSDAGALRRAWESGTVDWRRAVVMAVLHEVRVLPYSPRSPRVFNPERLVPRWRA